MSQNRRLMATVVILTGFWWGLLTPSHAVSQQATSKPEAREAPLDSPRDTNHLGGRKRDVASDVGSKAGNLTFDWSGSKSWGTGSESEPVAVEDIADHLSGGPRFFAWNERVLGWAGFFGILTLGWVGMILLRRKSSRSIRVTSATGAARREGPSDKQTVDLLETTLRLRSRNPRPERTVSQESTSPLPPPPPLPGYRIKPRSTEDS